MKENKVDKKLAKVEILKELLKGSSVNELARKLGLSDSSIRDKAGAARRWLCLQALWRDKSSYDTLPEFSSDFTVTEMCKHSDFWLKQCELAIAECKPGSDVREAARTYVISDRHLEYNLNDKGEPFGSFSVNAELDVGNTSHVREFAAKVAEWEKKPNFDSPTLVVQVFLPDFMLSVLEQNSVNGKVALEAKPTIDAMKHQLQCMIKHLNEVEYQSK